MVSKHYSKLKQSTQNSVQDNFDSGVYIDPTQPIMEFSIMKLFVINLIALLKNKVSLSKNFNIAPSELDRMYYWEYEYLLEIVNDNIKRENEQNEKEQAKYGNMNPRSMMRDAGRYMPSHNSGIPKVPSFGSPKLPSMHF